MIPENALPLLDQLLDAWSWTQETSSQNASYYCEDLLRYVQSGDLERFSQKEQTIIKKLVQCLSREQIANLPQICLKRVDQKRSQTDETQRQRDEKQSSDSKARYQAKKAEREAFQKERSTKIAAEQAKKALEKQQEKDRENHRIQLREKIKKELFDSLKKSFLETVTQGRSALTHSCSITDQEFQNIVVEYVQSYWAEQNWQSLDSQQAAAVGAGNNNLLLTARAGSGKTRTLLSRAAFLHKHCDIPANELMLLAFNRSAAIEMSVRAKEYFSEEQPIIMHFDALATALVQPEETIIRGDDLKMSVQRVKRDFLDDRVWGPRIRDLMIGYFKEDWDQIVRTQANLSGDEFIQARLALSHKAFDLKEVKSHGEKVIYNTLLQYDVKFDYEKYFRWGNSSYRPDFAINTGNGGVIIEYFGLAGERDYDEQSDAKRAYWRDRPEWDFIELSRKDFQHGGENGFRNSLLEKLSERGIGLKQLSNEELFERHKEPLLRKFSEILSSCISRCRGLGWTPAEFRAEVAAHKSISDAEKAFLEISEAIYDGYLDQLAELKQIDHAGVFWRAVHQLTQGRSTFERKKGKQSGDLKNISFVLVDEFQDLTPRFMQLFEAWITLQPEVQFFCVGDDWQAIYGFNGSNLNYFKRFNEFFSNSVEMMLDTNYRSTSDIVGVSNKIMQGLGPPGRSSIDNGEAAQVCDFSALKTVPTEDNKFGNYPKFPATLFRLIKDLLTRNESVQILSRTNHPPKTINLGESSGRVSGKLEQIQEFLTRDLPDEQRGRVSVSTVHKFKGSEADAVIVWDALPKKFPLLHPDWVFDRIFGESLLDKFSEERRLFYVATTRAKKELIYLIDGTNRSEFVEKISGHTKRLDINTIRPTLNTTMTELRVLNAYHIKDQLKERQYKYNDNLKCWSKFCHSPQLEQQPWTQAPWFNDQCKVNRSDGLITITYRS
jgi:DNA helicase-4